MSRVTWTRGTLTNDVAKRHVIREPELIARLHKLAVPATARRVTHVTQDFKLLLVLQKAPSEGS